jgi:hypothetical protein
MGEAKRRRAVAQAGIAGEAYVTDLEEVGKILELEKVFCDQCGFVMEVWPPENLNEHLHEKHPGMFWPASSREWEAYKNDTDLARRQNYLNGYRANFLMMLLQQRFDLYEKLVAAGVIIPPVLTQG